MFARRGEIQAASAAMAAGVPFCLSTVGICSIAEVTAATQLGWFQLYMMRDRNFMANLLAEARNRGVKTLVFTVDLPTPGTRYRDKSSAMIGSLGWRAAARRVAAGLRHPAWLNDVYFQGRPHQFGNLRGGVPDASFDGAWNWIRENFDVSVTWTDLEFVRRHWLGAIVIKGILTREDALEAVARGVDGIIVSNHGGRQLDGVVSTAAALVEVVDAVPREMPVLVDGGIRSGLDALKMIALGAKACLIGRAWAFALGAGGRPAVSAMLDQFRHDLWTGMVLTGCSDVKAADRSLLDMARWRR